MFVSHQINVTMLIEEEIVANDSKHEKQKIQIETRKLERKGESITFTEEKEYN